jgi:copper resistance protein B
MKAFLLPLAPLAIGLLLAFDASAQDHSQHQMPTSTTAQDHSRHQPAQPEAEPEQEQEPKSTATMDHAAMGHDTPDPKPAGAIDHAAMGHAMPRPADQPITPIPVLTDADRAAAVPPPEDHPVHDNTVQDFVLFNRLDAFDAGHGTGLEWEGQAWIGTDLNKLWLRSEGERVAGHTQAADLEVLYGRAFARWWDVVAGVRHDFKPGATQDFIAIGVMGVAPYKFEVEATAYIGQSGQTAVRFEIEYDTLLTNRLILQPLVEFNVFGSNDERRGIGSGLATAEAGLRLRYEFTRQFAPYIGVVHERAFGRTADFRRADGEDVDDTRFVAGLRIWF